MSDQRDATTRAELPDLTPADWQVVIDVLHRETAFLHRRADRFPPAHFMHAAFRTKAIRVARIRGRLITERRRARAGGR